jgi:AhpC/TSA family
MNRTAYLAIAFLGCASLCMAADDSAEKVEVGKKAPDFVMTGIDGKQYKLSDKLGKEKNVVLMFSRAHW